MCFGAEATWVPSVIAAVSAAGGTAVQQNALKDKDREAARGIMLQADIQRKAGTKVNEDIQNLQRSDPRAEQAAARDQFMDALRQAKLTGGPGGTNLADVGGASGRFAEEVSGARTASGAEGGALAGRLARIDAPMYQRVREGQGRANTASQLALLNADSANADFLTRLRTASIQPNPWGLAASNFGGNFAQGMATRVPKKPPVNTSMLMDAPNIVPGLA